MQVNGFFCSGPVLSLRYNIHRFADELCWPHSILASLFVTVPTISSASFSSALLLVFQFFSFASMLGFHCCHRSRHHVGHFSPTSVSPCHGHTDVCWALLPLTVPAAPTNGDTWAVWTVWIAELVQHSIPCWHFVLDLLRVAHVFVFILLLPAASC